MSRRLIMLFILASFIFVLTPATTNIAFADSTVRVGHQAKVAHTDGDPLRIREGASNDYDVVATAPYNAVLDVLRGPLLADDGLNWYRVKYKGTIGWTLSRYLTAVSAETPLNSSANSSDGTTVIKYNAGDYGAVANTDGSGVKLRNGPDVDSNSITTVSEGTIVYITDVTRNNTGLVWYKVKVLGTTGYINGAYLVKSAAPAVKPSFRSGGRSSMGDSIANFAERYIGYNYVWGGSSPRAGGFDCSGLVEFTYAHYGISLPRTASGQARVGSWVSADALQPGDLVFFANTFEPGISHVGIYIGNGRFVHADNERTGVRISDLWSYFYRSHYWGARRPY